MSTNKHLEPPDGCPSEIIWRSTAEQLLRDGMEAMGFPEAQSWSSGDCMAAAIAASDGMRSPWIPCSERMPEEGVDVLCCLTTGLVVIGYWSEEWGWDLPSFSDPGFFDDWVTHWMPLPDPPKG